MLVNKRSEIIKALLTMWAEEVRLMVDDVIQAYRAVMRKLGEKPNTIEHVFEIREWMESVPFALKTQDDIMKKVFTVGHFLTSAEAGNVKISVVTECVGLQN